MIYADFGSILVPEDKGKQNPNESYTKRYQKHVVCSYVVMVINQHVLIINLVSILNQIQVKMLFTSLLAV